MVAVSPLPPPRPPTPHWSLSPPPMPPTFNSFRRFISFSNSRSSASSSSSRSSAAFIDAANCACNDSVVAFSALLAVALSVAIASSFSRANCAPSSSFSVVIAVSNSLLAFPFCSAIASAFSLEASSTTSCNIRAWSPSSDASRVARVKNDDCRPSSSSFSCASSAFSAAVSSAASWRLSHASRTR